MATSSSATPGRSARRTKNSSSSTRSIGGTQVRAMFAPPPPGTRNVSSRRFISCWRVLISRAGSQRTRGMVLRTSWSSGWWTCGVHQYEISVGRCQVFRAAGGAGGDALPDLAEPLELAGLQLVEEPAADAVEVRGPRALERGTPRVGQARERAARVGRARLAPDEAVLLEAVDEPREPAAREQHGIGEVAHAHALTLGARDVDEHVVRGDGEPVLGLELGVERAHERGMGAQEAAPGVELPFAELTFLHVQRG